MGHLGDFGAALKELDPNAPKDTFGFFGEKFEVVDELPPMLIFQLAAAMTGKVEETEGMGAMWEALRVSLGEGEFTRFYKLAIAKRAELNSLMELVMTLFQASGGERPTVQVSDSPAGQLTTSPSSSTSHSVPPAFGGDAPLEWDRSVPHLVPVSQVLTG
jgi:hypothetical protein